MNISREQANIYKILADILQKVFLTFIFTIVFCIVMYKLIFAEPQWAKTVPLAAIEIALSMTIYKLVDHFYPTKRK